MEVATTRSILTLQAINVIGLAFIHSESDVAATLAMPRWHSEGRRRHYRSRGSFSTQRLPMVGRVQSNALTG